MEFIYKCNDLFFKSDLKNITTQSRYVINLHFKSTIETRKFYEMFSHTGSTGTMYIENNYTFHMQCHITMIKVNVICVRFQYDSYGMTIDMFKELLDEFESDYDSYIRKEKLEIILN